MKLLNERMFKIEDKVILYDETIRRRSKKFEFQWIGPYTIIEQNSQLYDKKTENDARTRKPNKTLLKIK